MTQPDRSGRSPAARAVVALLLAIGVAGTLVVPLYARTGPRLGALPFFYWYQLAWIPLVAILSWTAYLLTRRGARAGHDVSAGRDTRAGRDEEGRDESR
jgi:Protein of unknown function (DUF3311)